MSFGFGVFLLVPCVTCILKPCSFFNIHNTTTTDHEQHENENENENPNDSDNESIIDDEQAMLLQGRDSNSPGQFRPRCESTGLYFPSTTTMELLGIYDDGISHGPAPSITSLDDDGESGEPVFCRICREGLHDVDYDFEMEVTAGVSSSAPLPNNRPIMTDAVRRAGDPFLHMNTSGRGIDDSGNSQSPQAQVQAGRKSPSPPPQHAVQSNHPYAANPLFSPCECSGSMAFVHYLCIEQWRCRSHHPAAQNGLNCETCNAQYTLPPPPSRPDVNEEEDWLEAMPPHVLAALRRPHPCWQIGAAVVRRRWLRPIAPVLMSPIVALYCRGRRTLKKRGVSRRRWACSLCRRRARWKCVRCLRSYYCSRQCQNVSWHIVHKHVCYKPVRFWWSVAVYGLAFVYFLPGVLSYPLIYDLGLSFLWLSFVVTGVIGGGVATVMKKQFGFDVRGRGLEVLVVFMTCWLASVCWGLVWAFFGESDECTGVFNYDFPFGVAETSSSSSAEEATAKLGLVPSLVRNVVLLGAKKGLLAIDKLLLKLGPFITKWICYSKETVDGDVTDYPTCLRLAHKANPDFMTAENGENCISDLNTVALFWALAACMHVTSHLMKRTDRIRRVQRAAAARHPRPHQD